MIIILYRKIYYQCLNFIDNSDKHFLILTGPRQCGKTTCFKQLKLNLDVTKNIKYFNFKSEDNYNQVFNQLVNDKSDTIYLIDEITYVENYSNKLAQLSEDFILTNSKVKVLITGSQSFAIKWWSSLAFSTSAEYVKTSFIDFEEWLVYKNKILFYNQPYNVTEEDYFNYIFNSSHFTGILNNSKYLESCINETLVSELKSYTALKHLDINEELLREYSSVFLYSVLLSLHNKINSNTFNKSIELKLKDLFNIEKVDLDVFNNILRISSLSMQNIREIILFLCDCDLITITYTGVEQNTKTIDWLLKDSCLYNYKNFSNFLSENNICIKYPLFYINLLNELEKQNGLELNSLFNRKILGSIVECNLRALLRYRDTIGNFNIGIDFEYRDENAGIEVDYINYNRRELIEFSVRDKKLSEVKFNYIPNSENYSKTITSHTKDDGLFIPYYKYILQLSRGNFII